MARSVRHFSPPVELKIVRVNVGKRFTGTRKIRRFVTTERKAKEFITDAIAAAQERGRLAFAIPHALAVEAMELEKELAPHQCNPH